MLKYFGTAWFVRKLNHKQHKKLMHEMYKYFRQEIYYGIINECLNSQICCKQLL